MNLTKLLLEYLPKTTAIQGIKEHVPKDSSLGEDQFRKSEKTLQSAFLLWREVVFPKTGCKRWLGRK